MPYTLTPTNARTIIEAITSGKPYNHQEFMFYHLNRNVFNVQDEITSLRFVRNGVYSDNLGHYWTELSTLKNFFHMPKVNWATSTVGITTPYSRKFVRDDNVSGIEGEFEMIIRNDGKRIDALTHEAYQETYNFGRTKEMGRHKRLDVDPHNENGNYSYKKNMGRVRIIEKS